MGYVVRSKKLNVGLIIDDAQTIRQAKAAFKKYLKQIGVERYEMREYMAGLSVSSYNESTYETYITIK
jgi:hypothetical protein